jgi:CDP-paratose synthetase
VASILLTGGTGYLGSHLTRFLVGKGHQIVVLKRSSSGLRRVTDLRSAVRFFDLDGDGIERAFKESGPIDAVVHAATCYGREGESRLQVFDANTRFPLELLESSLRHGTKTFLNADTVLMPEANAYALSKRQFVDWGQNACRSSGLRFVNLKMEHFYGPNDDPSKFTTYVIRNCLRNMPSLKLTSGEQMRDFIFIDDVVSAYETLIKNMDLLDAGFIEYGVGSGASIRLRDFVLRVHELTASTTNLEFGAVPYRSNELMCSQADTTGLQALGWTPRIDLLEGLRRTIAIEKEAA